MPAPDYQLPVFSFRPNWADGVTERLEWLTNILSPKRSGAEQRIALRLSPRRSFEARIDPLNTERTFLELFGRRFGASEFMLPLWHDHAVLTAAASAGASSLSLDTTDREFVAGGMAILMGADAFSCEAVRIDTVAASSITLISPTTLSWPSGATIHPLRRSRFEEQPKLDHQTDRLDKSIIRFLLASANDYDGGAEELATYATYPILSPAPDWSDNLDLELLSNLIEIDNQVGLKDYDDPAARSFSTQMHRWMLEGRADHAAFRRLIYRLRGKQGAVWVPSFTSDLIMAAAAAPGSTYIDVKQCGLDYTDFPAAGRQYAITAAGEMLSLPSLAAPPGPGVERINLATPLVGSLAVGDALSFVDIGRFDTDAIEIQHLTDTDGVATVEAPLRTFANTRDGSADGVLPIPTATMDPAGCGCAPDPCSTEIYTGDLVITINAGSLPNWPPPSTGGTGHNFGVGLVVGVKDAFGTMYAPPPIFIVGSHADGIVFDYPDPDPIIITDPCGHSCTIGVTHTSGVSGSLTITVTLDSPHFRFTDVRQPQPDGVDDDRYADNADASYGMLAVDVGGTTETGYGGPVTVTVSLGGATPVAPAYEIQTNSGIGAALGTVPTGPNAGQHYHYTHYACSAFPTGVTP